MLVSSSSRYTMRLRREEKMVVRREEKIMVRMTVTMMVRVMVEMMVGITIIIIQTLSQGPPPVIR